MTRRRDAIRIAKHLAKTRENTRREFNRALDIIFLGLRGSRPAFSRAEYEDDYGLVEQECETIKKTLRHEIARRFGRRRGNPGRPIGYYTEAFIWSEMEKLTAEGMGLKKAAEAVHKKVAAERSKLFATWRKRFPGEESELKKLPRLITAQAIVMRWRRRSRD